MSFDTLLDCQWQERQRIVEELRSSPSRGEDTLPRGWVCLPSTIDPRGPAR
jgi:hypothetical protein